MSDPREDRLNDKLARLDEPVAPVDPPKPLGWVTTPLVAAIVAALIAGVALVIVVSSIGRDAQRKDFCELAMALHPQSAEEQPRTAYGKRIVEAGDGLGRKYECRPLFVGTQPK